MTEHEAIERAGQMPVTRDSLVVDLKTLGLRQGMTVLVHSSLSSLGWVCGGAVAVILALEDVLGGTGTLVMPAQSSGISDPKNWRHPPVPESWWDTIRKTMPPFDHELTPTREVGVIPETFRKQSGVIRSAHPQVSFAARGMHAAVITAEHSFQHGLGDDSPLARIYEQDGWVLLMGVGHSCNTSLHLAEFRASFPAKGIVTNGAPLVVNGRRTWTTFQEVDWNDGDFATIGEEFARETSHVTTGRVGRAEAHLMPQRPLVDFAVRWMEAKR